MRAASPILNTRLAAIDRTFRHLGGQRAMEIFPLVERVLDELYSQIPGSAAVKDKAIKERLKLCSDTYKDLTANKPPLPYNDAATRFAYIYAYVTCHSNLVFSRIRTSKELRELFKDDEVLVSCIGGGPGSDFLGILKYCVYEGIEPILTCRLFDGEIAWGESWEDIDVKVTEIGESKLETRTFYQILDITKPETYEHKTKYFKSDLFTMIYFVSEVWRFMDKAQPYFDHLFAGIQKDALVLYVDNNYSKFTDWIDRQLHENKFAVVQSGNGVEKMPIAEEK
jgi:hypothetical protein